MKTHPIQLFLIKIEKENASWYICVNYRKIQEPNYEKEMCISDLHLSIFEEAISKFMSSNQVWCFLGVWNNIITCYKIYTFCSCNSRICYKASAEKKCQLLHYIDMR